MGAYEERYLAFSLGQEEYAISVLKVAEIINLVPLTSLPQAPSCLKGVMHWRGRTVPVVDLREKMGLSGEPARRPRIVVVEYSSREMPHCAQVKNCGKTQCPAFAGGDRQCWTITATHCRGEIQGTYQEKIDACRQCDFYQAAFSEGRVRYAGFLVDDVTAIRSASPDHIDRDSVERAAGDRSWVTGLLKANDRLTMLLGVDEMLA